MSIEDNNTNINDSPLNLNDDDDESESTKPSLIDNINMVSEDYNHQRSSSEEEEEEGAQQRLPTNNIAVDVSVSSGGDGESSYVEVASVVEHADGGDCNNNDEEAVSVEQQRGGDEIDAEPTNIDNNLEDDGTPSLPINIPPKPKETLTNNNTTTGLVEANDDNNNVVEEEDDQGGEESTSGSMNDIEQAINILQDSCQRVDKSSNHGNNATSSSSSSSSSSSEDNFYDNVNDNEEEDNKSKSTYHSCSSSMALAIGAVKHKCNTIGSEVLSVVSNTGNNKNDTMEMSSDDDDNDEEKAVGVAAVPILSSTNASRSHQSCSYSRKKKKNGSSDRSNSAANNANHNNFCRNVIILAVISTTLIVLVGLGLGLSTKRGKNNNANNGSEGTSDGSYEEGIATTNDSSVLFTTDFEPTNELSTFAPTMTVNPSVSPSTSPITSPSYSPSNIPTSSIPSTIPSLKPSYIPTSSPTVSPTTTISPTKQFIPGDLSIINNELDIRMSSGLSVKKIAQTGVRPQFVNGVSSSVRFHAMMDGAGIIKLPPDENDDGGGYVYVSNSEIESGAGGVYGLYFNKEGKPVDYKPLLRNTSRNCGGGLTPWNTWISCEEVNGGQCWQVDPNPNGVHHKNPKETLLGGDGGKYETVTVDNRNPDRPIFFTTEDSSDGAMRRFEANGNGWDSLHQGGRTTFLRILDSTRFEWTTNESAARTSAALYYGNSEGIIYHDGLLYFAAKKTQKLLILDLQKMTYITERTGSKFEGKGSFNAQPDQIILENYKRWIYFSEDGGSTPGVYVRDKAGTYRTVFEGIDGGRYDGDETVGIALSPDRRKLYAGFQDAGVLMEFTRDDGLPFE